MLTRGGALKSEEAEEDSRAPERKIQSDGHKWGINKLKERRGRKPGEVTVEERGRSGGGRASVSHQKLKRPQWI